MIDAKIDLNIDINTLKAEGKAKIKSFVIEDNDEEIVSLKDKQQS